MKRVAQALYREPVVFLGVAQVVITAAAAEGAISGWIPVATLGVFTYLQRRFVRPAKT